MVTKTQTEAILRAIPRKGFIGANPFAPPICAPEPGAVQGRIRRTPQGGKRAPCASGPRLPDHVMHDGWCRMGA
ncbi:hypothetical protein GCM10023209_28460 [Roseibacterium beibuensis]|uniref:Uncharacterized protein n=1 Tax=[Roseibacterium] beibuensis TaxID=1193142 RepID=A0ABP9LG65_9RHOB